MTLIEVVTSVAILSIVVTGLGSIYVLSQDQWGKAGLQIRLQQAGTYCMEEMVRSLQAASAIEEKDDLIIARYVVPDLYIDSSTTFRKTGHLLQKNNKTIFPVQGLEKRFEKDIAVKSLELTPPLNPDSLYRLRLVLTLTKADIPEDMEFSTGFFLRNAIMPDMPEAQGTP
jgi:hypothetical protein